MPVDGDRRAVGRTGERGLDALGGEAGRLLRRALAALAALAADHQPRVVHHPEHRAPPAHFTADALAEAIPVLAIDHPRDRPGVGAELWLDTGAPPPPGNPR